MSPPGAPGLARSAHDELGTTVTRQNTTEEFDRLNILAPNFLAIKEVGKNMGGKNMFEIFEQVKRTHHQPKLVANNRAG